jgi:hypothetical protein
VVAAEPAGVRALVGYGVGTILDLREAALVASGPHPLAGTEGVRYLRVPPLPEGFQLPVPVDAHEDALVAAQRQMPRLVSAIVAEPAVTVVHCHSGAGRTGLVSLVLLSLAALSARRSSRITSRASAGVRLRWALR